MPIQTTYSETPPSRRVGGLVDSFGPPQFEGNHVLATRQLEHLTWDTDDGTYTITIDGVVVASFAASSDTDTEIGDQLVADLLAAGIVHERIDADELYIEAPGDDADDGFAIAIASISNYVKTQVLAHGQEVPFGCGLVADERAPAGQKKCRLPRVATDVTAGLFLGVAYGNVAREPNAGGWPHQSIPDILRVGRIYVLAEGAGTRGANLAVRHAPGAAGTQLGAFGVGTDTSTRVAVPGLRALEDFTGGGAVAAEYFPQT